VLLAKLAALAEHHGFRTIRIEALGNDDTIRSLLRQARRVAESLRRTSKVIRALRSIDSVSVTVLGTGVHIDRVAATPDRDSLSDVLVDLAAAAGDDDAGVLLAVDEAQLFDPDDLRRILAGIHRSGQDGLPLAIVLAGLPNLLGIAARAATYAERMFDVSELGPLDSDQVAAAVAEPARELGVEWADDALSAIAERSDGFPYFVQTWAYHTWNTACDEPISNDDVTRASDAVERALDAGFFAARSTRIRASEIAYVKALASLDSGPHRSGDVARALGVSTQSIGPVRDRLIGEGVVYAPRYGWVEFAIPHFDRFLARTLG
jgi:hypothetical protein